MATDSPYNRASSPIHELLAPRGLVRRAIAAAEAGASRVSLVSSGRFPGKRELGKICAAVAEIRKRTNLRVCASLGSLCPETALRLRRAGVSTYHHNLETAPSHYPRICNTHPQQERVRMVQVARASGLRVCSGGIFGMGETWRQREELARTLRIL